jgi:flagellar biogenesis protein FliO
MGREPDPLLEEILMTDTLWRLAWALPLVLLIGGVAVLGLKRFVSTARSEHAGPLRMSRCESLSLSDSLSVHLIEVDSQPYLVAASAQQAVSIHTVEPARRLGKGAHPWFQRFHRGGTR